MGNTNLRDAIFLAKEGRKTEARWLLEQILQADRSDELAWLWYAECCESAEERIAALETCLRSNPGAARARASLAVLRGPKPGAYRPPEPEEPEGKPVADPEGPTQPVRVRPAWAKSIPAAPAEPAPSQPAKPADPALTGGEPLVAVTGAAPAEALPALKITFASEPPRTAQPDPREIEQELEALREVMEERQKAEQELAAPEAFDPFASEPDLLDALALSHSEAKEQPPLPNPVAPEQQFRAPEPAQGTPGTISGEPETLTPPPAPLFADETEVLDALARIQSEQTVSEERAHPGTGLFEDPFSDTAPAGLVSDPFADDNSPVGLFQPDDSLAESELALMDSIASQEQPSLFLETPAFTVSPEAVSEEEFDQLVQRTETNLVQQGGPERPAPRRARVTMQDINWSELEQMGEPRVHTRRTAPPMKEQPREKAPRPAPKKEPREHPYIRLFPAGRDPSSIFAIIVVSVVVLLVAMSLGVLIALW